MKRRTFVKSTAIGSITAAINPISIIAGSSKSDEIPEAVWIENGEPDQLVTSAFDAFGGVSSFISQGDIVVVKPNIGWDRKPEFAANTNPDLIKKVAELCYSAGAKTVKVFDRTCNNPQRCYRNSLIEEYASEAGAKVIQLRKNKYITQKFKSGKIIKEWPIYKDYIEADKVINIPVAKVHSLSKVTLGLKNLMGVMGDERGDLHSDFDIKLIDIDQDILPSLTIIDAYRILTGNGPSGGNLADVSLKKTLIMSPCTVTADFVALKLFDLQLPQVGYIKEAVLRNLNRYDLQNLKVKRVSLS